MSATFACVRNSNKPGRYENCCPALQNTASANSKTGSGVWAGPQSIAKVVSCKLNGNESFAIESNYNKATVDVAESDLSGNRKGETDTWKGGQVSVH